MQRVEKITQNAELRNYPECIELRNYPECNELTNYPKCRVEKLPRMHRVEKLPRMQRVEIHSISDSSDVETPEGYDEDFSQLCQLHLCGRYSLSSILPKCFRWDKLRMLAKYCGKVL